jgi:hypothetical protein
MASEPVALVLSRLENVVAGNSTWTARCPGHPDSNNSLSVSQGTDGRALIHCHAGCEFDEVIQAMGLRARDLFVKRRGAR